jgi:hypothetical protein
MIARDRPPGELVVRTVRIPVSGTDGAQAETTPRRTSTSPIPWWFRGRMLAVVVLVVLVVAFILLRMWDSARDVAWEEPPPPGAGPSPDAPPTPAPPEARIAAIALSLILGALFSIALPAALDAVLSDDGGSHDDPWTLCVEGRTVLVVREPGGTGTVLLPDHPCDQRSRRQARHRRGATP